ncbi:MAG: nucleotidyltransferase domain-containing protein [Fibrobacteres bacterium]|nr:nucleotidyltransferase domain-containing protein [Fibrobacterota bacterium]
MHPIPSTLNDADFLEAVAGSLARMPGVEAVMLGGSRAAGRQSPASDWDFSIYYRGNFDVTAVRDLGWPGEVSALGGWGGGVFNGGAWLEAGGRRVDVHYRDLNDVERRIREAEKGEFAIEQLLFYLAGIPTYVIVAELALGQVLSGSLPRPGYPEALKRTAYRIWQDRAEVTLHYALKAYAERGDRAMACGSVARALLEAGHARLARDGVWITNEKTLLAQAGFANADALYAALGPGPEGLVALIERARSLISDNV